MHLSRVFLGLQFAAIVVPVCASDPTPLLLPPAPHRGVCSGVCSDVLPASKRDLQLPGTPELNRPRGSEITTYTPQRPHDQESHSLVIVSKRDISVLKTSWHVFWDCWVAFSPSQNTSATLVEMYSQLYPAILGAMASGARMRTGSFSYGDFQLAFSSNNNQTVQWDVLGDFILVMHSQLLRGLVGAFYQATIYMVHGALITLTFLNALAIVKMELSGDPGMVLSAQKLKKNLVT